MSGRRSIRGNRPPSRDYARENGEDLKNRALRREPGEFERMVAVLTAP